MAGSQIETGLPLDQWAEVMGFNLFYFNGFDIFSQLNRDDYTCDNVWYQHPWQKNYVSREEIASAVVKAEQQLADVLNYYPAERLIENESQPYPRPAQSFNPQHFLTPRGRWKALATTWQKLQAIGTPVNVSIATNVSVTRQDNDNDSVDESFVLSTSNQYTDSSGNTVTVTNPHDVAVYYSNGDRLNDPIGQRYRIRPVRVTIDENTNTMTITGHAAQLVKPELIERQAPAELNPTTASNYVTTLDVQHKYLDPNKPGTAYWNERPEFESARTADINVVEFDNADQGLIRPIIRSMYSWHHAPDRINIRAYTSGVCTRNDGRVDAVFARAIAYLACSHLPALSCGCERADQTIRYWRSPPSDDEFGGARPITASEVQQNPFGVSRGALYAFRQVMPLMNPTIGRI